MPPRARRAGRAAARGFALVAGLALLGYAGIVGGLYALQEKLIFPASTLPADYKFAFDLPFEELRIPVPGAELSAAVRHLAERLASADERREVLARLAPAR